MNMADWAKREIEIACKRERNGKPEEEWDYGVACYESAYKAYMSLMGDGHSGMSISLTKSILNRLLEGRPLTPIEDIPEVWDEVGGYSDIDAVKHYQCNRMISLFKDVYPDGKVRYKNVQQVECVMREDDRNRWYNGFVANMVSEKFPITFPYYPSSKPYLVSCSEGLSDPKNGDYDTMAIWSVTDPDGFVTAINRFFKEGENGWVEINHTEFIERTGIE